MADVRALLRSELASRTSTASRPGKKRKLESAPADIRKKPKSNRHAEESETEENKLEKSFSEEKAGQSPDITPTAVTPETETTVPLPIQPATSSESRPAPQVIDEDEWVAFERDVVAPTKVQIPAAAALAAGATISAAPVSAAELAEREEEERKARTRGREAELQGEQEEATRTLEDELDEMEQLDERVRRLKEKREEILRRRQESLMQDNTVGQGGQGGQTGEETRTSENTHEKENEDEEEVDEDDDEWDKWHFG
ncbi:hypothetical protein PRK78_003730 [Emydomyces testavorans]|uniref:Uncharacterized protein n=1 Tax=Emydomyces testavorans TaxID=2070801 RepID=A0AAF0DGQ3_9EURO|nr:hypothetical protein PRK78_003730 [Emydomyces testavorans]